MGKSAKPWAERLITAGQIARLMQLMNAIGLPADGDLMQQNQARFGGPKVPMGWQLMNRGQIRGMIREMEIFLAIERKKEAQARKAEKEVVQA